MGCVQIEGSERIAGMKPLEGISIVTVYDNYQQNPGLKTGWGFSCLI